MTTNLLPGIPLIESPFFEKLLPNLPEDIRAIAMQLHDNGFAVIDFQDDAFNERAERIKQDLQTSVFGVAGKTVSRMQDAWKTHDDVKAIAANAAIINLLTRLYGRLAVPFQTLNFRVGSQQHYHSDAIHFSSNPERFMCGVWVALEDVTEENGPLVYYPGSHKWLILSNEAIDYALSQHDPLPTQEIYHAAWEALVDEGGVKPQLFLAKKGQALIWAANLLHGGMPIKNPRATRWSQVTHYYFKGCSYYTPMLSNVFSGKIRYRKIVDITTGEIVPNICCGRLVEDRVLRAAQWQKKPKPKNLGAKYWQGLKALHRQLTK